jgi:GTP-binding protein
MTTIDYNQVHFLKSVAEYSQLPPDVGAEVAFAGASNSGKSSALNAITRIGRLARTSKTPGRTQLLNYFVLNDRCRLVDLPGYGFAKVPPAIKKNWEKLLNQYFMGRECLKGVILLMDIRHPLKPLDLQMLEWTTSYSLPVHILLTKCDKLKRGASKATLLSLQKELDPYKDLVSVQLFSSFDNTGVDEAKIKLDSWFILDKE